MENELGVVILNYNDAATTTALLSKIKNYALIKHIVVVDNCSTDDSFNVLSKYAGTGIDVVKSDKNGGYGYGNNYGIRYLNERYKSSHILICNPDVDIEENVLAKMLAIFEENPQVAIVAPYMVYRDGRKEPRTAWRLPTKYELIFSAGLFVKRFLRPTHYPGLEQSTEKSMEVDCVTGSLLMVNTTAMLQYGMYDENIFLFGEEITLGYKFKKAGFKTILLPQEIFVHYHSVSINKSIRSEVTKRKRLLSSWRYVLQTYLGASGLDLLLMKVVFGISLFEIRVLTMVRRKQSH